MITGGSDRKLRFWDFQSPGSSFVLRFGCNMAAEQAYVCARVLLFDVCAIVYSGLDNGERPPTYKRDTYEAIPVIQVSLYTQTGL